MEVGSGVILNDLMPELVGCSQNDLDRLYMGGTLSRKEPFGGTVWHQLFRRDVIVENGIHFNPLIQLNEDTMFTLRYLAYAESMLIIDDICYNYHLRSSGALSSILYHDPTALVANKRELALERGRINKVFVKLHDLDISHLYRGSLVLSAVELAVRLSAVSFSGIKDFKSYLGLSPVMDALRKVSLKGAPLKYRVPFLLLKLRCHSLLYSLLWLANRIKIRLYI